ncbi:MAG: A/G-specific adenine glycosylase [Alphaproteobacteria bacterium]|nr:A/G-specific adenine glycosylase [Alphaproteobacteria bacterium]
MQKFASHLLTWFYAHRRDLEWRGVLGKPANPYHVFLSEIMLQQTTSATVHDYFIRFIEKWCDLPSLAQADLEEILYQWRGLGYYARARNLHASAREIIAHYGGRIPQTESELKKLRGIGDYTAAAIASIAFNKPAVAVDGNIRRVCARLFRVQQIQPDKDYAALLAPFMPDDADANNSPYPATINGDMVQAMMELGSLICTPKKPKCKQCPLNFTCKGQDIAETLPMMKPKIIPKKQYCVGFWVQNRHGHILLHKRASKGLLGGMTGFPLSAFHDISDGDINVDAIKLACDAMQTLPITISNQQMMPIKPISHIFTHIKLTAFVSAGYCDTANANLPPDYYWQPYDKITDMPLPKLMLKIYKAVIETK